MKINLSMNADSLPCKRSENGFIKCCVLHRIKEYYDDIADIQVYNHWLEFARKFKDFSPSSSLIFRGQSNALQYSNLDFWQIQSNLKRSPYGSMELLEYLQNLLFSKDLLTKYGVRSNNNSKKINLLEIMAFLQHQGIPTPLVDFTKDPITALFFALSSLPVKNQPYEDALYHSVFEIDKKILVRDFGIREFSLSHEIKRLDILDQLPMFEIGIDEDIERNQNLLMGICYNDQKSESLINSKLQKQDGEFLFLHLPDKVYKKRKLIKDLNLEYLLKIVKKRKNIEIKPIRLHLIPYDSINKEIEVDLYSHDLLYAYFKIKAKTGLNLFEDTTGFKYDFMFNAFKNYTMVNPASDQLNRRLIDALKNEDAI